ncbi:ATP-grasp domain-containing protein [Brunnivagina elsteri]|uniref:ATP-grasp domain-containing protein n=1 Tax=Brunnivagina elsteri CCALA 953 TaxID=987040 RepID=A0A2A2TG06_9CYAN|nr:hypothetical protein [Calothrix elsteri]PAX52575.1 hypothetical protein CK510_18575 [Calothrix elsteri CCALA 953]
MIYAIGLDSDRTFCHFVNHAESRGIKVQVINLREVIQNGDWRFALPDDNLSWLSCSGQKYKLNPQASYYCRLIDLSTVQSDLHDAMRWKSLLAALCSWLEHIPGTVINRPSAGANNFSKPLHEFHLQSWDFQVADSVTSSNAQVLAEFASAGLTIVKTTSGIRADTRLVKAEEFRDFDSNIGPVHLQRYIAGADVRSHVVGNRVHSELIKCSQVDYRHSHEESEYIEWELPESLQNKIINATAAFGLKFAGWDFKVTEDNEYWCLEVNPMPGYDSYDVRAEGKITDSLLALLAENRVNLYAESSNEVLSEQILTPQQCDDIYSTIHSLKNLWIKRGESPKYFSTLGTASYLDFLKLANFAGDYEARFKEYNPILQEKFGWLYELIREYLERTLLNPVVYKEDAAMPGFHIWQDDNLITKPNATTHFDLQYRNLKWDKEKIDAVNTISFTLPIKLPQSGGGLNVWDFHYLDAYKQAIAGDVEISKRFRNQTFHPYTVGEIVVHSGHTLHQIAPTTFIYPGDERITLQCHGLYCDGQWLLYW